MAILYEQAHIQTRQTRSFGGDGMRVRKRRGSSAHAIVLLLLSLFFSSALPRCPVAESQVEPGNASVHGVRVTNEESLVLTQRLDDDNNFDGTVTVDEQSNTIQRE